MLLPKCRETDGLRRRNSNCAYRTPFLDNEDDFVLHVEALRLYESRLLSAGYEVAKGGHHDVHPIELRETRHHEWICYVV